MTLSVKKVNLSSVVTKFNRDRLPKSSFAAPIVGDVYFLSTRYPYFQKTLNFYSKSFLGFCVGVRKKTHPLSWFFLRNVFGRFPIEIGVLLNSPMIRNLKCVAKASKNKYIRNKLYYLRNKKNYFSRVVLKKKKL